MKSEKFNVFIVCITIAILIVLILIGVLLFTLFMERNEPTIAGSNTSSDDVIVEIIEGSSMFPTFIQGEEMTFKEINQLADYDIKHGDIILIDAKGLANSTGDKFIIRVIGLPGDLIEIKDGYVYRNEKRVEESYLDSVDTSERDAEFSSLLLEDDEFYVLGDNRTVSLDSRTFGPIRKLRILGVLED